MRFAKDASDKVSHLFKIKKSRIKTALFYALVNLGRDPCLVNNIIWDNSNAPNKNVFSVRSLDYISASYCDIGGGFAGIGNINCNPGFKNADACDYHLADDSNCIDAGDPCSSYDGEHDIDSGSRVVYSRPDIGCDEWLNSNKADYNQDGVINYSDFRIFANHWRDANAPDISLDSDSDLDISDLKIFSDSWLWNAEEFFSKADFNSDNIVNFYDYSLLANNWQIDVGKAELALFCKDWLWELKWN